MAVAVDRFHARRTEDPHEHFEKLSVSVRPVCGCCATASCDGADIDRARRNGAMTFDPICAHHVDHHVLRDSGAIRRVGELAPGDAVRLALEAERPGGLRPLVRRLAARLPLRPTAVTPARLGEPAPGVR